MARTAAAHNPSTKPLPGLAPWVGGKRILAGRLGARIDAIPHEFYGEPFVGMGGVFFRRRRPAAVEAVNDRAGDVVNLFRVVRHHPEALLAELRLQLVSRADFQRLLKVDPATLTDIQRAGRFVAIQRMVYGGQPDSHSFPARRREPKSFDAADLRRLVETAHDRLARVTIEHLDFATFLDRYDRPEALFYLDPPYHGCEGYYGPGLFTREDFQRLADILGRLRGRFIMSINDTTEIRSLFGRFRVEDVPVTYTQNGPKRVVELVVSGGRR